MTSRYDPHASLIEELFAEGESFTGIARQLEQKFSIPLDASGLRRWLLRRLAKKGERAPLVNPNARLNAAVTAQQTAAIESVQNEKSQAPQNKRQAISIDLEDEKINSADYISGLLEESEIKVKTDAEERKLIRK